MQTTVSRLASHKNSANLDIRLRFSSAYPVWRAIIVDREQVHVSVFLPGRRGIEADQYSMKKPEEQIAHAVIKSYQLAWKQAQEVAL
ncbi:hypothetical protein [Streptomyces lydicus]|uniref:hypothetical protein n=1 Tax=Streptomyces lydicus TaxID=47763 RepID=UPI00379BA157